MNPAYPSCCPPETYLHPDRLIVTYDGVEAVAEWDSVRQTFVVQSGPLEGVGLGGAPTNPDKFDGETP